MQNIRGKINDILKEQLFLSETPKPTDTLMDDLGADSLDIVELVLAIEEEFSFTMPDDDYATLHTVEDVYKYVERKVTK